MEESNNKKLLIIVGIVTLVVVVILVWYFYYAKPVIAPSLNETNNPLPTRTLPPRFQFINKIWETEKSTSSTEIINPLEKPLIQIWDKPSTGQTFVNENILKEVTATSTIGTSSVLIKKLVRATSTTIRFIDRSTGYIYGYPLETGLIYQISNTLIPGIFDAYFFDNGKKVLMRYIDKEKNTVMGIIANVPSTNQTNSEALPLEGVQYISGEAVSASVSNDNNTLAYVVGNDNGSSIYTISNNIKSPTLVSSSPFKEWLISFGEKNKIFLTSKSSTYVLGSTVSLPLFQSEISNKTGLITTTGDTSIFISSAYTKRGLVTFLNQNGKDFVLDFQTIASKCSFGKKNFLVCAIPKDIQKGKEGLPDDWFQGRISFNDDLYIVDNNSLNAFDLYKFNSNEEGIFDIKNIVIDLNNKLITFNNKIDQTLWLLNIEKINQENVEE